MACDKWEEMGLLYTSGELSEVERASFSEHLRQCTDCSGELEQYQREKEHFFSMDILGDSPSPACNAEIMRVCADARIKVAGFNFVSLFIRRSAVSLALLVFGFITVSSVVVMMENRGHRTASESGEHNTAPAVAAGITEDQQSVNPIDSLSGDSIPESNVNFAKTRGNLDHNGVVPVELQSK